MILGSSLYCVGIRQAGISALNSFHPEKDVQWSVPIRLQIPKEDVLRTNRAINIQPLRGYRMAFKPFGKSYLGIHPDGNTERTHNKRRHIPCHRLLIHSSPTGNSEEPLN